MRKIGAVVLAAVAGCGPPAPASFSDALRVELVRAERGGPEIRVVVKEGPALGALLAPLSGLAPKEPCRCLHTDRAIFHRPDGSTTEADFCSHCFDLPSSGACYRMPPAFFRAFEAQLTP